MLNSNQVYQSDSFPMSDQEHNIYNYQPSHVLPAVFAAIVGLSLVVHCYQNFRYGFWKVTFFMFWGGSVFTTGWILRCISSFNTSNANLYIAQTVFILAGPPIYSAAEYNILGRLMNYVPMHAPLHPDRLVYFFIYLGVAVESLTAAGASMLATAGTEADSPKYINGGTLISIALVLQGVVECLFMCMVGVIQYRCMRTNMLTRNVRNLCIMLYGTSTLILVRCIFRAIESFSTRSLTTCNGLCQVVRYNEWYLYVFEAVPMVLYTYWLNIVHPGRLLPRLIGRYLDTDGQTERAGPGWIDKRSTWETFVDPFDLGGRLKEQPHHEPFWLQADKWPVHTDGTFAQKTATNVGWRQRARAGGSEDLNAKA